MGTKVGRYGVGVRMGIVRYMADSLGLAKLGCQIAIINRIGSPLKFIKDRGAINTIINKYSNKDNRFSGYAVIIDLVEYFVNWFGNKVSNQDFILLSHECDSYGEPDDRGYIRGGIYKKGLTSLMKEFGRIEEENLRNVTPKDIKTIMAAAYADQIVEDGGLAVENMPALFNVLPCYVLGTNDGKMVGDVVQIATGRKRIALMEISTNID